MMLTYSVPRWLISCTPRNTVITLIELLIVTVPRRGMSQPKKQQQITTLINDWGLFK